MPDFGEYLYKKQFFISPYPVPDGVDKSLFTSWHSLQLDGLTLFYHQELEFAYDYLEESEIVCLGNIIDPENPSYGNRDIVNDINANTRQFGDLERALKKKAGRWIILARYDRSIFLYHDAAGLKSAFRYYDEKTGHGYFASQPELFADVLGLARHAERDELLHDINSGQWPPYVYPYDGITQLLPNHRANLVDFGIERYWPGNDVVSMPLDEAVSEFACYLDKIIYASIQREQSYISLTGGYDSRLLAACSSAYSDRIKYFTFRYRTIPRHDVVLPKKIADHLKLAKNYRMIDGPGSNAEFLHALGRNVSYMCLDANRRETENLERTVGTGIYLHGLVGETSRCFFESRDDGSANSADKLRRLMLFPDDDSIRAGFSRWLESVPASDIDTLELLYLECRLGIWGACMFGFKEAVIELLPPMNCRYLIELGLGVDKCHRVKPHRFFLDAIRQYDERLATIAFNTTRVERYQEIMSDMLPLPWRVKKRIGLV